MYNKGSWNKQSVLQRQCVEFQDQKNQLQIGTNPEKPTHDTVETNVRVLNEDNVNKAFYSTAFRLEYKMITPFYDNPHYRFKALKLPACQTLIHNIYKARLRSEHTVRDS